MNEHLTTSQVANALQVSESSVKRWCDRGVIPTVRTVGGHRRIPLDGLMEFLETTNRQLISPEALGLQNVEGEVASANLPEPFPNETLRAAFEAALIKGDEKECRRVLTQWFTHYQRFAPLADQLIANAFHRLGDMWDCREIEVYQERRGCEICTRLIHEVRRLIPDPPPNAPLAIGGSPSGDPYTLPSQLVEMVLRENGWRPSNLGGNLPMSTLTAAVQAHRPRLFWLSVSYLPSPEKFLEEYRQFADSIPPETIIVLGGRALDDRLRPQMKYTAHCDNMQQLARFAAAMHGGGHDLKASNN